MYACTSNICGYFCSGISFAFYLTRVNTTGNTDGWTFGCYMGFFSKTFKWKWNNTLSVLDFQLQMMISLGRRVWVGGWTNQNRDFTCTFLLKLWPLTEHDCYVSFDFVFQILSFTNFLIILVNLSWRKQCSIWT